MPIRLRAFIAAGICLACAGCASLDATPERAAAARTVERAIGTPASALTADAEVAAKQMRELLADGMSIDDAAQLAMLHHPRIRAAMLSIGISRADFVQSTLFSNPSLALSLRFPDGGGLANLDVAFAQNLAELWLIPHRTVAAQRELDRTILEASEQIATIVWNARVAYVRAVKAERAVDAATESLSIAEKLLELTIARQRAGSGSEIDVQLARSQKLEAENGQRDARLDATVTRIELLRQIGLAVEPGSLVLSDGLSEAPLSLPSAEALQRTATESRFDLRTANTMVELAAARVDEERAAFIRTLEVGVSLERSQRPRRGDRDWLAETFYDSVQSQALTPPNWMPREPQGDDVIIGPTIGVEMPLWDQNQARVARAERVHAQAIVLRDALMLEAARDVQVRLAQVESAIERARFASEQLLPAAERSVALAEESYQVGRSTLLDVFAAQRSLRAARDSRLTAFESAAVAQIELERAAACPVSGMLNQESSTEERP